MSRTLNIFVSHPSQFLTDCEPHGDGLIADRILRHLAERGHVLHVAVSRSSIDKPYPANVHLYPIRTRVSHTENSQGTAYRLEYALRVRALLSRLRKREQIDVIHQLNPVVSGISIFLQGLGC